MTLKVECIPTLMEIWLKKHNVSSTTDNINNMKTNVSNSVRKNIGRTKLTEYWITNEGVSKVERTQHFITAKQRQWKLYGCHCPFSSELNDSFWESIIHEFNTQNAHVKRHEKQSHYAWILNRTILMDNFYVQYRLHCITSSHYDMWFSFCLSHYSSVCVCLYRSIFEDNNSLWFGNKKVLTEKRRRRKKRIC